ncbi:glutathione S-transferase family protein (plasmid) [Sinorhizobium chiapasense]|uniref:glutathione S-transferase family protein n=1 Tax=Sinorhizobium chiapasense TaxID=501572 RepID=UPI002FDF3205
MSEYELYNAPQSTCSQRVRYTLHAKGLRFVEHKLDLFRGDQLKPDYLAINPNGVVPALVHNGTSVLDSSVIMEYLEDIHPEVAPLRPSDPLKVAEMRAKMRYIDEVPTPAVRVPSYNLAFLPHYQAMTEEEFLAVCESKPLRREFLLKMGRTGFPKAEMDEALGRLQRGVGRFARWLDESGGPFVLGRTLSLADIAIMPVIVRMDDINLGYLWASSPAVGRWLDLIRETDAFAATYYHGSLLTEKYPHLQSLKTTAA